MSQTVLNPELQSSGLKAPRWMVVIYNNEINSIEEVVEVLIRATACDLEEASIETWEAHVYGKAPVHFSGREDCEAAAAIISAIGVKTDVLPEWED
jgi:ATP-dependent Clp protease adaptor protein ClpS